MSNLVTVECDELEGFEDNAASLKWALGKLERDAHNLGADLEEGAFFSERDRLKGLLQEAGRAKCAHIDKVRANLVAQGQRSSMDPTTRGSRPWCEQRGGWWESSRN